MARYLRLGKVLGIEITLHISWFLVFALLTWGLAADYFPQTVPNYATHMYWILGASSALLLFLSVLLHEICHSLVAKYYKIPVRGISLFFFGGVSQIPDEDISPKIEILMAGAGPTFSIVFATFCLYLQQFITGAGPLAVLVYVTRINYMLGIFNFMPAFPLDGGRVMRSIIWWKTKDFQLATKIASTSGKIFASFLIFIGIFGILTGFPGTVWFVLLGTFLYFLAEMGFEQVLIKKSLDKLKVKDIMVKRPTHLKPDQTIYDVIHDQFLHEPHEAYPVMKRGKLVGILTTRDIQSIMKELRKNMKVQEVMKKPRAKAKPNDKVYPLLTKMAQEKINIIPVFKLGRLVGILRQEDIIQYVRIHVND